MGRGRGKREEGGKLKDVNAVKLEEREREYVCVFVCVCVSA